MANIENKTAWFGFRLTKTEVRIMKRLAAKLNLRPGAYLRQLLANAAQQQPAK